MRVPAKPLLNLAIAGGLLLAVWPLAQTGYGHWSQRQLAREWEAQKRPAAALKAKPAAKVRAVQSSRNPGARGSGVLMASAPAGVKAKPWQLTKISIPSIELEAIVVNGWDETSLRRGPAHEPHSGTPGEGNCVIAGHRNVYGSPFYRLDELLPGTEIFLETPTERHRYLARSPYAVSEADLSILQPPAAGKPPILTLITCTLPHSPNRFVLQAELADESDE